MSQRETDTKNPIKFTIGALAFVLMVVWFIYEHGFEPLIGILVALEMFLLWVANRNDKLTTPAIIFAIGIFVVGLLFIIQQKNVESVSLPSTPAITTVDPVIAVPFTPTNTTIPPTSTLTPASPTKPVVQPSPTNEPARPPATPTATIPMIIVRANSGLSSLMPSIEDVPPDMKLYNAEAFSDREMALGTEFPANFYLQLSDWGSLGGYLEVYDVANVCSASVPYQVVSTKIFLLDSEQGAIDLFEWMSDNIKSKAQAYSLSYWDVQDSSIGNQGFQYKGDVLLCLNVESSQYHRIVFQRYNAIVTVDVTGFDSKIEQYSLNYWAKSLANIIDVNIVAEANK